MFSASCHNEEEVVLANKLELDCILVGPVNQTSTHPEANPIGWSGFDSLVNVSNVPAYALGGLKQEDKNTSQAFGGKGVAGIRMFS